MISCGLSVDFTLVTVLQQLRQTFEREELTLQRHQDRVRRRHGVDGEKVERRRAVDQHVAEIVALGDAAPQRLERAAQPESTVARLADFELEAGEIERGGRDREARDRGRQHGIRNGASPISTS